MKKSEKYLEEEIDKLHDNDQPWYDAGIYDGTALPILNAIKVAQIDAIEATCKRCAELVEARFKDEPIIKAYLLDGSSILKVADKMKEELNET